jgi:hypothetical protein
MPSPLHEDAAAPSQRNGGRGREAASDPTAGLSPEGIAWLVSHASHSLRGKLASASTSLQMELASAAGMKGGPSRRRLAHALAEMGEMEDSIGACAFVVEVLSGLADGQQRRQPLGNLLAEVRDRSRAWDREGAPPRVALPSSCGSEFDGEVESKPFLCLVRSVLAIAGHFAPPSSELRLHAIREGSTATLRLEAEGLAIPEAVAGRIASPPAPGGSSALDSALSFHFFVIDLCRRRLGAVISARDGTATGGSSVSFSFPVTPIRRT